MKILALDHFFGQDLESLRWACRGQHTLRHVDFQFFRERFLRIFPEHVLGTDFAAFGSARYARERATWQAHCRAALHELYALFAFDVVVLPSDIFPYIRDVIPAAHELGVPVVVAQKETTISPYTLQVHAKKIGAHFPFVSDYMTVCSERQKLFWTQAGAPTERIEVTGQPRFDFYRQPERWQSLAAQGIERLPGRKVILLLSYWLGAYIPIEDWNAGRLSWATLRSQTEDVLLELVAGGQYQLLVKPHPQQPLSDVSELVQKLRRVTGDARTAVVVPSSLDTRHLLVNADVVVGFQTTALLEALLLDCNVIYTCWGEAYEVCKDVVLPYERHPEAMRTARTPQALSACVQGAAGAGQAPDAAGRLHLFEHYLGLADGHASERTLAALERVVAAHTPAAPQHVASLREALARTRRRGLLRQLLRATASLAAGAPLTLGVALAGRFSTDAALAQSARTQRQLRRDHQRELVAALSETSLATDAITGYRRSPLLREGMVRARRRLRAATLRRR